MKYKNNIKLIIGTLFCSILFLLFSYFPITYSINAKEDTLTFTVVSDIHIQDSSANNNKFKTCLHYLNKNFPNMDAFLVAGDITNSGSEKQYNEFNEIYNNNANKNWQKIISMGNHDYWNELSTSDAQKRFEEKTGCTLNSHTKIKGYHFIAISSEDGECHGTFTDKSKSWLKSELDKAISDCPNNPIFLIVHQPIKNTVYGSDEWGNYSLNEVLKNYPQVIVFSGHSHYPLNDGRSINQKDYTAINTGSLSYISLEVGKINGNVPPRAREFSQGIVVEVTSKLIKFIPTDFYNNQALNCNWTIKLPINKEDFQYTDNRGKNIAKPHFNPNDFAIAKEISYDSATIDFNTGIHPDFVHSYQIQVYNMNNNKIEQQVYALSDFYLNKPSERQTVKIDKLIPNTKYKISINAIESYGNISVNALECEFKTNSK